MANSWFRMYAEFSHDPKVQMMSEAMQRRLLMLMCMHCDGSVTSQVTEIAFHWRISDVEVSETKALFVSKGFIDEDWNLVNWDKRQFISDSSKDRTKRYRERMRTSHKKDVTSQVTKRDALEQNRTEQNRTEPPISPEMVSRAVLTELAISSRELILSLDDVCQAEMAKGRDATELRDALITAYRDYQEAKAGNKLDYSKGAAKFFGEGDWRDKATWPWKEGMRPQPKRVYVA